MYCPTCGTQNEEHYKFCRTCGMDLTSTTPIGQVEAAQRELTEVDLVRDQLKDEYDILEELGRGGMAIVFKARERQLERDVAIKVLPFSLAFDKEFVERFQREARTAAKLEHPSIIPIYRVGKSGKVIYFVMKFLRGKPLSALLGTRGSLPVPEIKKTLIEVGRALAYAHKSGIVHRDIKPDNIMFDEHGQAVVTDFGIAKAAVGGKLTGTGMAIGTPHYMSPEQAKAQQLDGRSDLYSLGVVAYQCLAGVVPFDGEDSFSIGYKHIMEELPAPRLDSAEKRELFEIIRKMMAKKPDDRFQKAEELVAVLEGGGGYVSAGLSTAATRAIPSLSGARLGLPPTTPLPRQPAGAAPAEPARHKKSALAAVGVWVFMVVAIVGGLGLFAYKRGLLAPLLGRPRTDTSATADSTHLAAGGGAADSAASEDTGGTPPPAAAPDTAKLAAGYGKLLLLNVPAGARVTLDGLLLPARQADVTAGTHHVAVRVPGYLPYDRQVPITAGQTAVLTVQLQLATLNSGSTGGGGAGPCDQFGPAYNQDNVCFDTRPIPLTPTFIPVPADAPVTPRPAILLLKVSRDGRTLEARVYVPSNVATFNDAAVDMAKNLRWNPAQKNGEPVEAWVQWQFPPVRQ
jgi:eukaryotic-like serine/threonine-protein kinase